jgi:hypothetical protein
VSFSNLHIVANKIAETTWLLTINGCHQWCSLLVLDYDPFSKSLGIKSSWDKNRLKINQKSTSFLNWNFFFKNYILRIQTISSWKKSELPKTNDYHDFHMAINKQICTRFDRLFHWDLTWFSTPLITPIYFLMLFQKKWNWLSLKYCHARL